eukprot:PhM_4_TR3030/c0_g1_i1/m.59904
MSGIIELRQRVVTTPKESMRAKAESKRVPTSTYVQKKREIKLPQRKKEYDEDGNEIEKPARPTIQNMRYEIDNIVENLNPAARRLANTGTRDAITKYNTQPLPSPKKVTISRDGYDLKIAKFKDSDFDDDRYRRIVENQAEAESLRQRQQEQNRVDLFELYTNRPPHNYKHDIPRKDLSETLHDSVNLSTRRLMYCKKGGRQDDDQFVQLSRIASVEEVHNRVHEKAARALARSALFSPVRSRPATTEPTPVGTTEQQVSLAPPSPPPPPSRFNRPRAKSLFPSAAVLAIPTSVDEMLQDENPGNRLPPEDEAIIASYMRPMQLEARSLFAAYAETDPDGCPRLDGDDAFFIMDPELAQGAAAASFLSKVAETGDLETSVYLEETSGSKNRHSGAFFDTSSSFDSDVLNPNKFTSNKNPGVATAMKSFVGTTTFLTQSHSKASLLDVDHGNTSTQGGSSDGGSPRSVLKPIRGTGSRRNTPQTSMKTIRSTPERSHTMATNTTTTSTALNTTQRSGASVAPPVVVERIKSYDAIFTLSQMREKELSGFVETRKIQEEVVMQQMFQRDVVVEPKDLETEERERSIVYLPQSRPVPSIRDGTRSALDNYVAMRANAEEELLRFTHRTIHELDRYRQRRNDMFQRKRKLLKVEAKLAPLDNISKTNRFIQRTHMTAFANQRCKAQRDWYLRFKHETDDHPSRKHPLAQRLLRQVETMLQREEVLGHTHLKTLLDGFEHSELLLNHVFSMILAVCPLFRVPEHIVLDMIYTITHALLPGSGAQAVEKALQRRERKLNSNTV